MVMVERWNTCLGGFRSSALDYSHKIGVHALGHQLFEQGGEMGHCFGEFDDCAASRGHCTKLTCKPVSMYTPFRTKVHSPGFRAIYVLRSME